MASETAEANAGKEKFKKCPRCANNSASLIKIEAGMRLGLQSAGLADGLPDEVCPTCYQDLAQHVSEGAKLRAEMKAKAANRANMWANRVVLIKQGRQLMFQRAFAEAAVAYEKYLRIVEIVHDLQPGEIHPGLFKNTSQNKELMIITSVYWDLLRIYDSNPRYLDRQMAAAGKLAEFARHTTIFMDIAKRALEFSKKAKNRAAFEIFLKQANVRHSRCFIASSAFDSHVCPEVLRLRLFRDHVLKKHRWGRGFVRLYYAHSPRIADFLQAHPRLKRPLRLPLRIVANLCSRTFRLKIEGKS